MSYSLTYPYILYFYATCLLGEFEGHLRIYGDFAVHLSDSCIDNTTLLNTVSGRDAASKDLGDSCNAVFVMLLWYHLDRYLCRLLLCVLEEQNKFLSRHHADRLLEQLLYCCQFNHTNNVVVRQLYFLTFRLNFSSWLMNHL